MKETFNDNSAFFKFESKAVFYLNDTNVANGSHGNTLTEVDSPFISIDKETLSFRSEGISYIIKLIY
jgi:hypothetical protein